jgi:prevent-host-death family protein
MVMPNITVASPEKDRPLRCGPAKVWNAGRMRSSRGRSELTCYDVHQHVHGDHFMAQRNSIAEARSNLPNLIREAETGKIVELTRRGEPVAVLIGRKRYEQLTSRLRPFSEVWDEFTRKFPRGEVDINPDEIFRDVRDKDPGRDFKL